MPLCNLLEDVNVDDDPADDVAACENVVDPGQAQARRDQTANARSQARVNSLKRRLGLAPAVGQQESSSNAEAVPATSWADRIVNNCLTKRLFINQGDSNEARSSRERARATKSLVVRIAQTLLSLLTPPAHPPETHSDIAERVHLVLGATVFDETNSKLRGPGGERAVYTILNTVATVHVKCVAGGEPLDFLLPTPMLTLPSPKTLDLHTAVCAFLPLCSSGPGHMLQAAGLPATFGEKARWRCHVLVGDALKTNDALFKLERRLLHLRAPQQGNFLSLRLKCVLHQLCLIRKPVVLGVSQFWPTLIRLGHLMESYAYRKQLLLAAVQVARSSGGFRRCLASQNLACGIRASSGKLVVTFHIFIAFAVFC